MRSAKNAQNQNQAQNSSQNSKSEIKSNASPRREMFDPAVSKPKIPFFLSFLTNLGTLIILPLFGKLQDFLRNVGLVKRAGEYTPPEDTKDFPDLYQSYEAFFKRNIYARIRDCFNKPICGVPGGKVDLLVREPRDKLYQIEYDYPGTVIKQAGNLASYNYLGFANVDGVCAVSAVDAVREVA